MLKIMTRVMMVSQVFRTLFIGLTDGVLAMRGLIAFEQAEHQEVVDELVCHALGSATHHSGGTPLLNISIGSASGLLVVLFRI